MKNLILGILLLSSAAQAKDYFNDKKAMNMLQGTYPIEGTRAYMSIQQDEEDEQYYVYNRLYFGSKLDAIRVARVVSLKCDIVITSCSVGTVPLDTADSVFIERVIPARIGHILFTNRDSIQIDTEYGLLTLVKR